MNVRVRVCIHVFVCELVHTLTCMYVCIYVSVCARVRACVCVYVCVCMCV